MVKSNPASKKIKEIVYRPRLLAKSIIVNKRVIKLIIISSHYEEKHSSYMSDDLIELLAKKLDGGTFIPKPKTISKGDWESFAHEPLRHKNKNYRLVWYWEKDNGVMWILHCHRINVKKKVRKYEKKK